MAESRRPASTAPISPMQVAKRSRVPGSGSLTPQSRVLTSSVITASTVSRSGGEGEAVYTRDSESPRSPRGGIAELAHKIEVNPWFTLNMR